MIKRFLYRILIEICLWQLLGVSSVCIPRNRPANVTVTPHTWHPTLFLAFPVSAKELQMYIDPQLKISKSFLDETAYLLLSLSNTVVTTQSGFADIELSTLVIYKNCRYKTSLHLHFNNLLAATFGPLYTPVPYGYTYAADMHLALDEKDHRYEYIVNDGDVQLSTSIRWNPNVRLNVATTKPLSSSLLNPTVNSVYVESLYKYGDPKYPLFPILYGEQRNYTYDKPLHPCKVNYFISTFIEKLLAPIKTVSKYPKLCAFTLQRSANVTSASSIGK